MKQAIETGTDVAIVSFFDPAALPPNFDRRKEAEGLKLFSSLQEKGQFWFNETGADGGYLFHFYVNEDVPERIRKYSLEPKEMAVFHVPSGVIWACGVEYAGRDPINAGLGKFAHMGGKFEMPPGDYKMTVWICEWPEDALEREFDEKLGGNAAREERRLGVLTGGLFLGSLALSLFVVFKSLTALATGGWGSWLWLWVVTVVAWVVTIPTMRKLSRKERNPGRRQIEREFPCIVVQLKKLA